MDISNFLPTNTVTTSSGTPSDAKPRAIVKFSFWVAEWNGKKALSFSGVESIDSLILTHSDELFTDNALLANLNSNALSDPRVQVINGDALSFLEESPALYDVSSSICRSIGHSARQALQQSLL